MKCVICLDEVKMLENMWGNLDKATEFKIEAGYGSLLDGLQSRAWICDNCLNTMIRNKTVELGSYEYLEPREIEWVANEQNYEY